MNRQQRRSNKALSRSNKALILPRKYVAEKQREGVIVHKLIEKTAKEISALFYEKAASQSNNFYKAFPNQADWMNTQWPDFVGEAKKMLSTLLGKPATSEEEKEFIYEALCLDRMLPKSQTRGLN